MGKAWKRRFFQRLETLLCVVLIGVFFVGCGFYIPQSDLDSFIEVKESATADLEDAFTDILESFSNGLSTVFNESAERIESSETSREIIYGDMTVHFLDVGQGLSILVESGEDVLIYDGGDRDTSSFVVAYLKKEGIESIDYMISSHYDADHLSGLIGCLNAFEVECVISSDYKHDTKTYQSFENAVANEGLEMIHPEVGTEYDFGTGSFVVLAPDFIDEEDSNRNSVVIKLINGENSFVFTGDAEYDSEAAMCAYGLDLTCDILSIGHHGSASSTSWAFLETALPEYAVISCGAGNSFGHPDGDVLEKLEAMEIALFRNDKQGTIIAVSDGYNITWVQEPCNDYTAGDE